MVVLLANLAVFVLVSDCALVQNAQILSRIPDRSRAGLPRKQPHCLRGCVPAVSLRDSIQILPRCHRLSVSLTRYTSSHRLSALTRAFRPFVRCCRLTRCFRRTWARAALCREAWCSCRLVLLVCPEGRNLSVTGTAIWRRWLYCASWRDLMRLSATSHSVCVPPLCALPSQLEPSPGAKPSDNLDVQVSDSPLS